MFEKFLGHSTFFSNMAEVQPRVTLNTGIALPLVGFGTYHTVSESGIGNAVDAALRVGYRLFDTRKKFRNEELLGQALEVIIRVFSLLRRARFV